MKPSLGRYVVTLPRADGTFRVLFSVPPRLRPRDWPATIPLPIGHGRRGDLADPFEVERIRSNAVILYGRLRRQKAGASARADVTRDLNGCVRLWQSSQQWKANRPRTQKGYHYDTRIILRWADKKVGTLEGLRPADIEEFLAQYDDRPTQRYSLGRTLRLILQQAVKAGWIAGNPATHVLIKQPKTTVRLWTAEDVVRLARAADLAGQPGLAAMIHTQWEIGQRLTDLIRLRHGCDYDTAMGEFHFIQSKTGMPVAIPVSRSLRRRIAACRRKGSDFIFCDGATDDPFGDVARLWRAYDKVRPDGERLVLRALRHSCVVELARAGCAIPEIVAVSGHSLASAHSILQTYLPRDSRVAANAQRRRGLI